jgi:uncharacterized protein (TIGR02600 family)
MNRPPEKSDFPPSGFSSTSPRVRGVDGRLSGAALVIVLSFLVILTGLIVAFLSSITHETSATSAAASAMTSRNLADSAIQLTMAQIRDSTAGFVRDTNGALLTNSPVCWASQPGAIWNWDTNGSNTAVYKLYSSTNMVANNGTYNPTNDLPAAGWWSNTALYVDLNSPVVSAQGTTNYTNYPIFDPALAMTNPATGVANSSNYVDGFTINTNTNTFPGYYSSNPAAMPVTWLYILRDGTMIAPDASSTTTATFANAATRPSSNNPIVGRIAFWADDETCKLNINTASEGSYWATPSFTTFIDMAMGLTQPVAREYNRFPGHPASTCLSPVLWFYMGLSHPAQYLTALPGSGAGNVTNTTTGNAFATNSVPTYLTNLFSNITPRYVLGGSYAGLSNTIAGSNAIATNALPTERLYASVDEMFFAPTNSALTNRISNAVGITQQQVNQLRFFLTAQSRAPEVNPLNLPKICMWPVPDPNNKMTANPQAYGTSSNRTLYDQTIAFCTTLGTNAYYFTRYDATSAANDIAAGAVTGRNQKLYNYLRNQLDMPIPGFAGGAFTSGSKWAPNQANQITTLLYDYIRSDINLCDSTGLNLTNGVSYIWGYSYTRPPQYVSATNIPPNIGTGQVVPIMVTNATRGMGRFPTIRSGLFMFIARAANQPPLMCHPDGKPIVYLTNGTQISSYDGTNSFIQSTYITNVLSQQACALINPLHPWTCPQTNVLGNMTNAVNQLTCICTNLIINFTTNNGVVSTNIVSTNLITNAVLADSSASPSPRTNDINNINQIKTIYPIFNLSNNPLTPWGSNTVYWQTFTFPTVTQNGSTNLFTVPIFLTATNGIGINAFTNSTTTNYYSSATNNASTLNALSHAGLPCLTIQNPSLGSFNISNSAYRDTNSLATNFHSTHIEGVFIPDLVNVSPGAPALLPNIKINITGLNNITIGNVSPFRDSSMWVAETNFLNQTDETSYGIGWAHTFWNKRATVSNDIPMTTPFTTWPNICQITPSSSFAVPGCSNSDTFYFGGGSLSISLQTTNGTTVQTVNINFPSTNFPAPKLVSALTVIGIAGGGSPAFISPATNYPLCGNFIAKNDCQRTDVLTFAYNDPFLRNTNSLTNSFRQGQMFAAAGRQDMVFSLRDIYAIAGQTNLSRYSPLTNWNPLGINAFTADTLQSVECLYGDTRLLSCLSNVPPSCFSTNPLYGNDKPLFITNWPFFNRNAFSMQRCGIPADSSMAGFLLPLDANGVSNNTLGISGFMSNNFLSLIRNAATTNSSYPTNYDSFKLFVHKSLGNDNDYPGTWIGTNGYGVTSAGLPYTVPTCDFKNRTFQTIWTNGGDFDNGLGNTPDGPFVGKPDEGFGNTVSVSSLPNNPYYYYSYMPSGASLFSPNRMVASPVIFGSLPVFDNNWNVNNPATTLTAASWRTLQFSPNPNALSTTNVATRNKNAGYTEGGIPPTNSILPDHLLLDFFTMPVVEPYPISDPFSTAGKVNMNYRIAPFVQITRDAALRGVLKPVLITAVDEYALGFQKMPDTSTTDTNTNSTAASFLLNLTNSSGNGAGWNAALLTNVATNTGNFCFQYPIHLNETLRQFTNRFGANDLFRSPSEICTIWLYPSRQPTASLTLNNTNLLATNSSGYVTNSGGTSITYTTNNANIKSWWYNNPGTTRKGLTGDNTRERPYNYLYPRLTTKSNTYQLHYRVQTLKQTPTAHPSSWNTWIDPARGGITDKIVSEQRGSAIIERYIDPSDTTLPDFTTNVSSGSTPVGVSMDTYYRFRVINAKVFTP